MSYTLISADYTPTEGGVHLVQGVKGNRTPKGAIKGGNGSFIVKSEFLPAEYELCFKDSKGEEYYFQAYELIKECMVTPRLTENKRNRIKDEVYRIAKKSSTYNPEEWIKEAVKNLKI